MSNAWIDQQERRTEWPIRLVVDKDLPKSDEWPHHRIVVTAGLHHLSGNDRPYFTVTAALVNKRKRGDNAIEAVGCMHELIAEQYPELAPVIALHLSSDDGTPMHAVGNARYWAGRTKYKTAQVRRSPNEGLTDADLPYLPYLVSHLRVTEDVARNLTRIEDEATFAAAVEAQRPRWQREAEAAIALLIELGAVDNREAVR